jgi:hypothetical protein
MQMKEKLTKNHYKGFDRRCKYISIASGSMLVLALAIFLPLTSLARISEENILRNQNETKEVVQDASNDGRQYIFIEK